MARTDTSYSLDNQKRFSLKDHLFNKDTVSLLASGLSRVLDNFDEHTFTTKAVRAFEGKELKERIGVLVDYLAKVLSDDFEIACRQILIALPEPLDPAKSDNDFGSFIYESYNSYIAKHGCNDRYFDIAMQMFYETTKRFSAEFAIRYFIRFDEDRAFAYLREWTESDNYHVRRLVSEGSRPRLPWGGTINTDHSKIIRLLDRLYYDETRYVVRSVANNLNDISKIDPLLILTTLKRWKKAKKHQVKEFAYLERHALRTLIKSDHEPTLEYLGYRKDVSCSIRDFTHHDEVLLGQYQELSFSLTADDPGRYLIDYKIYFKKADGTHKPKVFKIKDISLEAGEQVRIRKRYPMRPMSTRALYLGEHYIAVQINGKEYCRKPFILKKG